MNHFSVDMKVSVSKSFQYLFLIISILLLGLILAIYTVYRCRTNPTSLTTSVINEKAAMVIQNLKQTATRDGVVEWHLFARSAWLSNAGKIAELEDPQVTFFSKDQGRIELTAKHGRLHMESNDFDVSGTIVISNQLYRLHTETLQYQHKGRIIIVDSPVEISGNRMNCKAARMTFDLNTNRTVLQGQVDGFIRIGQNE